jgi:hypothetical protein
MGDSLLWEWVFGLLPVLLITSGCRPPNFWR